MYRKRGTRACSAACGNLLAASPIGQRGLAALLTGEASSSTRRAAKHEKSVAGKLGGAVQPASGSLPGRGGDVKVVKHGLLLELKYTDKSHFKVNARLLDKIAHEASVQGLSPGMQIDVADPRLGGVASFVVLPLQVLERLLEGGGVE